ncbi:MAG: SDR family NAD(P)-dependent oxidoreductase [Betaproteobacteria bacterium]|nr:SDR family NAD(P)-dependent oxidoreductase [Betaproteobacteria bacterium]
MDLELRGRKVLITGASKGIGLACAHGFAAEGARVHIASRSEAGLKAAADVIAQQHKAEVSIHPFDLGKTQNVLALAQACGDADILVNNAGAIPSGSLSEVDDETWRHAWELKVFGYINLTRELYQRMGERGAGVIVNVIGVAGERPRSSYIAGTTGNAALMAFTRALGSESVDRGVRVVGVNPGGIQTERAIDHFKEMAERELGDASRWQEIQARVAAAAPTRRTGKPSQVADLVAFLASARASHISGTIVTIDNGNSVRVRA